MVRRFRQFQNSFCGGERWSTLHNVTMRGFCHTLTVFCVRT